MAETHDTFERNGALRLPRLVHDRLGEWREATEPFFALGKPGHRISDCPKLARLAGQIVESCRFTAVVGGDWRCVRAIAFNKSPDNNWSLGWHQDRTIAVARRAAAPGYTVWSSKDGLTHVEPPFALLERMVTLRVHLDDVTTANAPLLVALGSHNHGKVAEPDIASAVERSSVEVCLAEAGDGWIYATPILHASARSASGLSRRTIQLDFSRDILPAPLEWAGIG